MKVVGGEMTYSVLNMIEKKKRKKKKKKIDRERKK
jgi:hypothetical protein